MMSIEHLPSDPSPRDQEDLIALLIDVVEGGASVQFQPPLSPQRSGDYWAKILDEAAAGKRVILVARDGDQGNRIRGSVQLVLDTPENQRHRADVSKLLTLRTARRRGIAQLLMEQLEIVARREKRSLLTLDTLADSAADRLYRRLGYVASGRIPGYALNGEGALSDTIIFYKQLV